MSQLAILANLPVEDYLTGETVSAVRHEYSAGQVYAMSGATRAHNRIAGNLFAALRAHYRGAGCQVFIETVKLRIRWQGEDYFYYPDVMVTCDTTDNASELYCERPCLLIEVLSASTARIDREEKLRAYTALPDLQTYLLVAQDAPRVSLYRRGNDWRAENFAQLTDAVELNCAAAAQSLALTLAQIYEDIFNHA